MIQNTATLRHVNMTEAAKCQQVQFHMFFFIFFFSFYQKLMESPRLATFFKNILFIITYHSLSSAGNIPVSVYRTQSPEVRMLLAVFLCCIFKIFHLIMKVYSLSRFGCFLCITALSRLLQVQHKPQRSLCHHRLCG